MGQWLTSLRGEADCDVALDFENAVPHSSTKAIYDRCEAVVAGVPEMLQGISTYGIGCTNEIREALNKPSPEADQAMWAALVPRVRLMKSFHNFSNQLGDVFPELLLSICSDEPLHSLQASQALAKQLASIFDFVLQFDGFKMQCPALQNDFAFYRRNSGRVPDNVTLPISDEDGTTLAILFAGGLQQNMAQVNQTLAAVATVCQAMVAKKAYSKPETEMLCLRAMVAAIVLFDHLDSRGAFHKRSPIPIKKCVQVIRKCEHPSAESLLNSLRYSTKHLNDSDTPSSIVDALK